MQLYKQDPLIWAVLSIKTSDIKTVSRYNKENTPEAGLLNKTSVRVSDLIVYHRKQFSARDDVYTFTPTIIQPIDGAGSSKSPQELCQHVHRELLQRELPEDHHGQRDGRVHVSSCNSATKRDDLKLKWKKKKYQNGYDPKLYSKWIVTFSTTV